MKLKKLWARDKGRCHLCGGRIDKRREASRDHLEPASYGGKSGWTNIALAHQRCNQQRNRLPVEEARVELFGQAPVWSKPTHKKRPKRVPQ